MKKSILPFQIGEQYEKWEFDLEYCNEQRIKGCDSYVYLCRESFLHIIPSNIVLVFSLDVLELVVMTVNSRDYDDLVELPDVLENYLGCYKKSWKGEVYYCIFNLHDSNELWLILNPTENTTLIIYGTKNMLDKMNCHI